MFNLTPEKLEQTKATHTATEIHQQPEVWQQLFSEFTDRKETYKQFIQKVYAKHEHVRVVFTGAGTSAFVGDTLVPELRKQSKSNVQFESIPTTDIVSNPTNYFSENKPTVLVSFARSGNSPESVAAVSLGEQIIKDFYQVIITCNNEGKLAKNAKSDDNSLVILTPEKSHDKGFAMTSSFTSMLLTAYSLFSEKGVSDKEMNSLTVNATKCLDDFSDIIDRIVDVDFERIVYLGSGLLGQLAHEAALKLLELSAGKVVALHESSLGFRHGPKSVLNDKSIVMLFISQDPYTRKYDLDILRELHADGVKVVALTTKDDQEVEQLAEWTVHVIHNEDELSDFYLSLLYIIFAQAFSLKKSIQLGITPDNPSPDGKVNRVVQGVTIHPFEN
ncbi:Putative tagatose-6-phosphate ketose/aldose isomerase [Paraliobacillus sp. PM-2]|uniref:SIS domain-containing protein n=1 Tax=Paraliobacillus sp. PM-2 TaxID=1462524 RepID=UPI00061CC8A2|nr:SIS domain-containing protein [Paraliobacillus sp. PM-2]CQR47137.1 Putative tagatose-6-phosphate ketose/aldose isomerase [Paraliobacillus sp. PM-2]